MDAKEIKKLIKSIGLKPSRCRGQNFLIDKKVLKKIIQAADLKKDDLVLEIGPGLGVLTQELAKEVKKVLAVELDKKLFNILKSNLKDFKNLKILEGDILKIKNQELAEQLGKPYKVVANLPYSITSAVLKKFLSYEPQPKEMVVLVQKEVAERIMARPGQMSLLALSVQFYGQPEIIELVPKKSFYPLPEVDSAILKIRVKRVNKVNKEREKKFWQLAKIGFSAKRKQLQNNLAAGLKISSEQAKNGLIKANLNPLTRAQNLSVSDWLKLTKIF